MLMMLRYIHSGKPMTANPGTSAPFHRDIDPRPVAVGELLGLNTSPILPQVWEGRVVAAILGRPIVIASGGTMRHNGANQPNAMPLPNARNPCRFDSVFACIG